MALLPWWDVEASVAEAERAAGLGLRGVNMTSDPQQGGAPDLADRAWDPLWEVCTRAGLPINFHIGASETSLSWFGSSPWPSQGDDQKLAIGSAMMYLTNARVIANLIFSACSTVIPTCSFVSVESGIGWIPFVLEALEPPEGRDRARSRWTTCRCRRPSTSSATSTPASGSRARHRRTRSTARRRQHPVRDRLPAPDLPLPRQHGRGRTRPGGPGPAHETQGAAGQRSRALPHPAAGWRRRAVVTLLWPGGRRGPPAE